jgi:alpha-1,3-rhamnosyl/mannosyltransferase
MRDEVMIDVFAGLIPAGGIGRYVRDLCVALLTRPDAPPARFAVPRNLRGVARERYPAERLRELPLRWRQLRWLYQAGAFVDARFDSMFDRPAVFHSTLGCGPAFADTRLINHIHDLTVFEHPEWHPAQNVRFIRNTTPHAIKRADTVLTHSHFVARRVAETFGVPESRIVTIPPPLGHAFRPTPADAARERVTRRFGLDGEFVLHVGALEPRKNHTRLVGAFERLRRAGFPGPLVLVGQGGWRMSPILERIERSPEATAIRRLEDVAEDDLVALYGACTVCAYPSLEEGFGMPVLESMACGAACVTSDHPTLTELGQGYAVAVPADDEAALADALVRLWKNPDERRALTASGPARAAAYSFERWAPRIFALYRHELARAGPSRAATSPAR